MNANNPARPENLESQYGLDTERAEAEGTLVDIDRYVREAKQHGQQEELNEHAQQLIARLADLQTIRSLAAAVAPRPTLGAYELLEEIGRGGMGAVYRAKHKQLGKIQALKVIQGQAGLTPEIRARFRREVQAIGALEHRNIISAHAADFEGDVPYLVMDYVEGESLAEVLKRLKLQGQRIPVGAACELVRQAAIGLQYAHERKITHRDIKPGNLMLDGEGVVRVLDLGLARLGAQDDEPEQEATELTRGGQILGTPDYMSPEQLQSSRDVDARTDVYALGVTLFSLLVGRPVYKSKPGESFIAKASRILHEPVPDLRKLLPDVPQPLTDIITKCLAKSPDERIQSAGELAEAITPWASREAVRPLLPGYVAPENILESTGQSATSSDQSGSGRSRRTLVAIGLAILLPLLIAAGVMLTLRLPGGGMLVVDCDDPNANIQVVAVQNGQRKDLSLSQETGNQLRLEEGRWTVLIEGVDASEFSLSENEVVINGSTSASIRVTRKEAVAEPRVAPDSSKTQSQPFTNDSAASPPALATGSGEAESKPDERSLDWQSLRTTSVFGGLLSEPQETLDGLRWQIRPWLPPVTQHAHYLTENRVSITPTGGSYAIITPYDCKIIELASGRVTHTIPSPANSRWGGVALTANAEHVALLSEYGDFVEVHDARNRIIAQWDTGDLIDTANSFGAIAWIQSGEQLLVWDSRHASLVDLDGKLQTTIDFPAGAGPAQDLAQERMLVQRCVEPHPENDRIAFGCSDGRTRVWDLTDNTLRSLASERGDEPVRSVHWSPDGKLLAALRAEQWTHGVALETWNSDGKLLTTVGATQLNATHQSASEFAWSPDSRSLALGSGKIIDPNGALLRELDLLGEAHEHGSPRISSTWIPSWSTTDAGTQRIDFVATGDTYGLQCGRVKSFTPTGRLLPSSPARNLLQPQEVSWIEETAELAVVFSRPDSSVLRTWSIEGQPQRSVAIPQFVSGKIQARTGKLLCHSGSEMSIFDRSGALQGSYSHGPDHGLELSQWQWDHAGKQIANFGTDALGGVIRLIDDSGESIGELRLPAEVSKGGFNASSGYLYWSADDQHLALSLLLNSDHQQVFVWDLNEESTPTHVRVLEDAQTPRLAWSPDGRWLAIAPGTVDLEQGTTLQFLHPASGEVKEHVVQHDYYPQWHAPEWFDERSIRVGGLALNLPTDPGGEIRVLDLGFTLQDAIAAVNMQRIGEVLLVKSAGQNGNQFEVWKDGSRQSSAPAPQITSSEFARNPAGTKAVFLTGNPHDAFVQIDLRTGEVVYLGMALDNESTLELSLDGSVRKPAPEVDAYLAYTLHYPGGSEVTITRADFEKRKLTDAPHRALQWIVDIGGAVQVEDDDTWFSGRDSGDDISPLSPSQIVSIDLTGCMLNNESLARLVHFENLQSLDVSSTRLTSLEHLPKLEQLTALGLRRLRLTTLSTLRYVDSLRRLDLSHCPVDSSMATTLLSAMNLQSLNLSHTNVDRFLLDDLIELPNLSKVVVRQTKILPEELERFSELHPSISFD